MRNLALAIVWFVVSVTLLGAGAGILPGAFVSTMTIAAWAFGMGYLLRWLDGRSA